MTGTLAKGGRVTRAIRKGWLAFLFVLISAVVVNDTKAQTGANCNIDPAALNYVQNAIASQPSIANNPQALAAYMAIIGQESAYNTQAVGRYVNNEGQLTDASYGLGQVNYFAHQDAINSMVMADTGTNISTLPYNDRKAIAGQWLLDNPQAASNLSAQIFADNLAAANGNISQAVANYNGGSDPNYLAHVQSRLDQLEACGIVAASNLTLSSESIASAAAAEGVLECPDLALAEALEVAREHYTTVITQTKQEAIAQAVDQVAASPLRNFLGNIGDKYCFRLYQDIYDTLRMLTDPLNLIRSLLNALLNQILNWACSYVTTMLNNVLTSICLPLPSFTLSFNFGLSQPNTRYCNGVSLADFIYFGRADLTFSDVAYGVTGVRYAPPTTTDILRPITRELPPPGQVPLP